MKAFQYSNGANLDRTFLVHMTLEIPGHLSGRLHIEVNKINRQKTVEVLSTNCIAGIAMEMNDICNSCQNKNAQVFT
jgi:hypothetical protein